MEIDFLSWSSTARSLHNLHLDLRGRAVAVARSHSRVRGEFPPATPNPTIRKDGGG